MPGVEARRLDAKIRAYILHRADRSLKKDRFGSLALEVFRHQYAHNRTYRRYCHALGVTPADVGTWRRIPALPVAAFKETVVRSYPGKDVRLRFRTSGTTSGGERRGTHELDTDRLYRTSLWRSFHRHVLSGRAVLDPVLLVPLPTVRPDSSLSYMAGEVARRMGRKVRSYVRADHRLDERALTADLLRRKRPVLIFATAFSLKIYLDELTRRGIRLRLPRGSRLMETGGFKGRVAAVSRRALYRSCRERLGLHPRACYAEYGMTELSSQAYAAGQSRRFKLPPWMRVVAADPASGRLLREGQRGALRFYDLANRPSVLAVQTEDMGRVYRDGFVLSGRMSGAQMRGCSLSYERYLQAGRR